MQLDRRKFLAISLSMTLGGVSTVSCRKKSMTIERNQENLQTDKPTVYLSPYEEFYPPIEEYADDIYRQPYGECKTVWNGTVDAFLYSYSVYDQCYVRCFSDDQTQCYIPKYECIDLNPTGECLDWKASMHIAPARQGACSSWEFFTTAKLPTIECIDYHL